MEKFFDFVAEGDKVAEIIAGKVVYFLMGTTGCGKSTTI
jgi:ABC-type sugar transport system ATPase subunit